MPGSSLNECQYPHIFPSPPNFNKHFAERDTHDSMNFAGNSTLIDVPMLENDQAYLETAWFFYLGEIALKRLMNRILSERFDNNNPYHEKTQVEKDLYLVSSVAECELQLEQWYAFLSFLSLHTLAEHHVPYFVHI